MDGKPSNSAVNIRDVYPESGSRSQNAAGDPGHEVVEVSQPVETLESKYQFPTQALKSPQSNSKITEDVPRHGFRMLLGRPLQIARERKGDSTISFSSSPFDEFRKDAGPSRRVSEANTSTIAGWESGSRPKSKLSGGDEGNDIEGGKIMFPRQKGEGMVPRWDGGEGRSREDHREKGKERDDRSCASASTDYISVSNEVEEHPRFQGSTPVSPARSVIGCVT